MAIREKYHRLGSIQKEVIKGIAESEPSTQSALNKKIGKDRGQISRLYHGLLERGIIETVGKYTYRGRSFDIYWLTPPWIQVALLEGANPELVLKQAEACYGDRESFWIFRFLCDIAKQMHPAFSRTLFEMWISPVNEPVSVDGLIIPLGEEQMGVFLEIARKYPGIFNKLKEFSLKMDLTRAL